MILGLYIGSVYLQGASWRIEFDVSRARSSDNLQKNKPPESVGSPAGEGLLSYVSLRILSRENSMTRGLVDNLV